MYIGDDIMEKIKQKLYDLDIDNLDKYLLYDRDALLIDGARTEGIETGREEKETEIVIEMLKDNLPMKTIQKYTKLSLEKIAKIKQSMEDKKDNT